MGRSVGRIIAAAGLGLLALATVGFARAAPPPPGDVPSTTPAGYVCLSSAQGSVCVERPVLSRDDPSPPTPQELLEALLDGASAEEQEAGLYSAIPAGTVLHTIDMTGDECTVRLAMPEGASAALNVGSVEQIVRQIGLTLEPVGWRHLHIEAVDPETGQWVPLSSLLPPLDVPRKPVALEPDPNGDPSAEAIPVGQPPAPGQGQPVGSLSGKTVYVSAGHGWQWSSSVWRTQRPPYPTAPYVGPIIEDHNNAEVVNQYLLRYLWNAGAMVWPVRERDMGDVSVIVNNDSPGAGNAYAESGGWATCADPGYDLDMFGHTCRYAATVSGPATAVVTYSAALPADGEYAVYVWFRHSGDSPPDARYAVRHAGGDTTVLVDQTRHGFTWHYIGTYAFRASEGAVVTLDNVSSIPGRAVIADAIRVGGGTFDDLTGIDTAATFPPDRPWWEVASFYYAQRQGLDPDDWPDYNDVIARPIYARWEHRDTGDDAVFVSWHTNGHSGNARGTESYIHSFQPTEGSAALQDAVHTELIHDIQAGWEPTWADRGVKSEDFGELRELWDADPNTRMPGVLLEVGFHDNPEDTDALKDPRFEMLAARAVYQGIVKYFEQRDAVDLPLLPEPPTHLRVANDGSGRVTVVWDAAPVDDEGLAGDAATGFRVYVSSDGLGWADAIPVTTTTHTLTDLTPGALVFVRVSATNPGGESFPTETLGARIGTPAGVLIVSGFHRIDRFGLVQENDPTEGANMRMLLERANDYGYTVHHGEVIQHPFDSASSEAVAAGAVLLSDYQVVDWVLGEEALLQQTNTDVSLDVSERAALAGFLDGDGALFISGSEIAWDLDYHGHGRDFYQGCLRAAYAGDDADTYQVAPVYGSIFDGLGGFGFDAPGEYDPDYPDIVTPLNGSTEALQYDGGAGGTAAVQYAAGCQRVVNLGFPFETITPAARPDVMSRVMDFLDECLETRPETAIDSPVDGRSYGEVPPFDGSASSSSGLEWVDVSLRRGEDGAYWDGVGWGATPWHVASGTHQWSFTMPVSLTVGAYTARARAWDTELVSDTTPAEVSFSIVSRGVYLPLVLRGYTGPAPGCNDLIVNGGFENSDVWEIVDTAYLAGYTTDQAHTGARSMRVGIPPDSSGVVSVTYSSISQTLSVPAGYTATLRYWTYPICQDPAGEDLQYVWLVDGGGETRYLTPLVCENLHAWDERELDLTPYAGQTVSLRFSVKNDGDDRVATTYLDDVRVEVCPQ